ncbi:MAG: hypothetical protein L0H63_00580 [Nitrococcus sp.]|nr:hypothetical protein [Nitrococcus sp.]
MVGCTGGGDGQRERHTVTDGGNNSISTLSIWSEKINGKGEDGPPLILLSDDYSFGVIAVSDGVGGAGSRQVHVGGRLASGAKIAATNLLEVLLVFFKGAWLQTPPDGNTTASLGVGTSPGAGKHQPSNQQKPYVVAKVGGCSAYLLNGAVCGPSMAHHIDVLSKTIDYAFEKMNREITEAQSPSRLKSKILRNLPSTLAGWVYRTEPEREITAFWAGDSRCYVLHADGLRQVSRDEAKGNYDSFEAIWADPPLTNYISEKTPNCIQRKSLLCDNPAILICASDGAFNYLPTPMDFEFVVLSALNSSETMQDWANKLAERLLAAAGDDVSIILHPVGFSSFENLKRNYKGRLEKLDGEFLGPIKALKDKEAQLERELASLKAVAKENTKEAWSRYRDTYDQYLHDGDLL